MQAPRSLLGWTSRSSRSIASRHDCPLSGAGVDALRGLVSRELDAPAGSGPLRDGGRVRRGSVGGAMSAVPEPELTGRVALPDGSRGGLGRVGTEGRDAGRAVPGRGNKSPARLRRAGIGRARGAPRIGRPAGSWCPIRRRGGRCSTGRMTLLSSHERVDSGARRSSATRRGRRLRSRQACEGCSREGERRDSNPRPPGPQPGSRFERFGAQCRLGSGISYGSVPTGIRSHTGRYGAIPAVSAPTPRLEAQAGGFRLGPDGPGELLDSPQQVADLRRCGEASSSALWPRRSQRRLRVKSQDLTLLRALPPSGQLPPRPPQGPLRAPAQAASWMALPVRQQLRDRGGWTRGRKLFGWHPVD
jgi:hypothetical protein